MSEKKYKLLPCPFCGAKARINDVTKMSGIFFEFIEYYVECSNQKTCGVGPFTHILSKDEAIKAWNTRK